MVHAADGRNQGSEPLPDQEPAERADPERSRGGSASGQQDPAFGVGDRVLLAGSVPYLKTADPMPMLRPPDLVTSDEVGLVVEIRARDLMAIRFRRGTFLIAAGDLRPAPGSD